MGGKRPGQPTQPTQPTQPQRRRRRDDRLPVLIDAVGAAGDTPAARAPTTATTAITWTRALKLWEQRLRSGKTKATYLSHVRAFMRDADGVPLANLTHELLGAYAGALAYRVDHETKQAGKLLPRLAPATVNLKIAAVKSFLRFARLRGWLAPALTKELIEDALTGVKAYVQRPYQIVEGEEVDRLLDAAAADPTNPKRAQALVGLALRSGLRLAELCALNVGDLATDATSCYVDVRQGKGRKDRQVPLAEDVYTLVLAYLSATGRAVWSSADRATPLFLSRNRNNGDGGRLSERQTQTIIDGCAERAGFETRGKHITTHSLRHSYGIDVLKGDADEGRPGAPVPAVSKLMGHSSVAVTGKYLNHFERGELAAYAPRLRRTQIPAQEGDGQRDRQRDRR